MDGAVVVMFDLLRLSVPNLTLNLVALAVKICCRNDGQKEAEGSTTYVINVPCHKLYRWTIDILTSSYPNIGMIVDFTLTTRYYNFEDFQRKGVDYCKVAIPGQQIPSEPLVKRFFAAVDYYLENHSDDSLIGVHCTHGVNRTGYMIARYMIQRLGFSVSDALDSITVARGHPIERLNYIKDLSRHLDRIPRNPDGSDILHGFAREDRRKNPVAKMANKRNPVEHTAGKDTVKRHGPARDGNREGRSGEWKKPRRTVNPWEPGCGPEGANDFALNTNRPVEVWANQEKFDEIGNFVEPVDYGRFPEGDGMERGRKGPPRKRFPENKGPPHNYREERPRPNFREDRPTRPFREEQEPFVEEMVQDRFGEDREPPHHFRDEPPFRDERQHFREERGPQNEFRHERGSLPMRETRGPPAQFREERRPPPLFEEERGPNPHFREERGPPPPFRDERGPQPFREERGQPQAPFREEHGPPQQMMRGERQHFRGGSSGSNFRNNKEGNSIRGKADDFNGEDPQFGRFDSGRREGRGRQQNENWRNDGMEESRGKPLGDSKGFQNRRGGSPPRSRQDRFNQGPTPRRNSPPGRQMSPNGRRMSPPTRRSPTGRRMSPPARRSPPGRRMSPPTRRSPTGRRMSPPTRRSPPGRRMSPPTRRSPPGRRMSPPQERRMSPGRMVSPGRRMGGPPGRRMSPQGRMSPQLRRMSPQGRRMTPPSSFRASTSEGRMADRPFDRMSPQRQQRDPNPIQHHPRGFPSQPRDVNPFTQHPDFDAPSEPFVRNQDFTNQDFFEEHGRPHSPDRMERGRSPGKRRFPPKRRGSPLHGRVSPPPFKKDNRQPRSGFKQQDGFEQRKDMRPPGPFERSDPGHQDRARHDQRGPPLHKSPPRYNNRNDGPNSNIHHGDDRKFPSVPQHFQRSLNEREEFIPAQQPFAAPRRQSPPPVSVALPPPQHFEHFEPDSFKPRGRQGFRSQDRSPNSRKDRNTDGSKRGQRPLSRGREDLQRGPGRSKSDQRNERPQFDKRNDGPPRRMREEKDFPVHTQNERSGFTHNPPPRDNPYRNDETYKYGRRSPSRDDRALSQMKPPEYSPRTVRPSSPGFPEMNDKGWDAMEQDCRELILQKRINTVSRSVSGMSNSSVTHRLDTLEDVIVIEDSSDPDHSRPPSRSRRRPASSRLSPKIRRVDDRSHSPRAKKPIFDRLQDKKPPVFERLESPPRRPRSAGSPRKPRGAIRGRR